MTATILFLGLSTPVAHASQPSQAFNSCEELLKIYPKGVANNAAVAKRTGATLNKLVFKKSGGLNKRRDDVICWPFRLVGAPCSPNYNGWTLADPVSPYLITCTYKPQNIKGKKFVFEIAAPGAVAMTLDCFISKKCGEQTPAAPISVSFKYAWGYMSIQQVATPAADQCTFVPVTLDIRGPSSVIQLYLRDEYRNLLSMLDFSQISRELGVKQYSMQVCGYKWTANTDPLQRVAVGMPVKWCKAYLVPENDSPTSLFTQFTGNCSN
jgi:hypothetical protein